MGEFGHKPVPPIPAQTLALATWPCDRLLAPFKTSVCPTSGRCDQFYRWRWPREGGDFRRWQKASIVIIHVASFTRGLEVHTRHQYLKPAVKLCCCTILTAKTNEGWYQCNANIKTGTKKLLSALSAISWFTHCTTTTTTTSTTITTTTTKGYWEALRGSAGCWGALRGAEGWSMWHQTGGKYSPLLCTH